MNGKKVCVFDRNSPWAEKTSDPSVALSTYSFERMRNEKFEANVELFGETPVKSVVKEEDIYILTTEDDQAFQWSYWGMRE